MALTPFEMMLMAQQVAKGSPPATPAPNPWRQTPGWKPTTPAFAVSDMMARVTDPKIKPSMEPARPGQSGPAILLGQPPMRGPMGSSYLETILRGPQAQAQSQAPAVPMSQAASPAVDPKAEQAKKRQDTARKVAMLLAAVGMFGKGTTRKLGMLGMGYLQGDLQRQQYEREMGLKQGEIDREQAWKQYQMERQNRLDEETFKQNEFERETTVNKNDMVPVSPRHQPFANGAKEVPAYLYQTLADDWERAAQDAEEKARWDAGAKILEAPNPNIPLPPEEQPLSMGPFPASQQPKDKMGGVSPVNRQNAAFFRATGKMPSAEMQLGGAGADVLGRYQAGIDKLGADVANLNDIVTNRQFERNPNAPGSPAQVRVYNINPNAPGSTANRNVMMGNAAATNAQAAMVRANRPRAGGGASGDYDGMSAGQARVMREYDKVSLEVYGGTKLVPVKDMMGNVTFEEMPIPPLQGNRLAVAKQRLASVEAQLRKMGVIDPPPPPPPAKTEDRTPKMKHGSWGNNFSKFPPNIATLARKWRGEGVSDKEITWRLESKGIQW